MDLTPEGRSLVDLHRNHRHAMATGDYDYANELEEEMKMMRFKCALRRTRSTAHAQHRARAAPRTRSTAHVQHRARAAQERDLHANAHGRAG